ncbi:MAG: ATP synthase F1 subunit delta [Bacteroidales bacterium]|nr:ATP synthase F1 subunit delta [Bacteroidales bacterium]
MNSGAISKRYATALLRLTLDKGSGEKVCAQVLEILHDPSSLPSPLEPDLKRFITLLVKNGRTEYLKLIFRTFVDLYCQSAGLAHVQLTSAVPSPELEQRVKAELERRTAGKVLLESEVDPSLIGGYRVEFNGIMMDASVRRQLDMLQRQFVEKNNRIV